MSNLPHNVLRAPPPEADELRGFSTLKKSLSAISSGKGRSRSPRDRIINSELKRDGESGTQDGVKLQKDPPLFVDIPKVPEAAEAALSALQYLPTPLLVLSSLKTVILANEAMGRLLGLDALDADNSKAEDRSVSSRTLDLLRGQSLSQIGIDVMEEGQSIWVSWEKFLDNLADEFDCGNDPNQSREDTASRSSQMPESVAPTGPAGQPSSAVRESRSAKKVASSRVKSRALVHDAVVNVIISSQYLESGNVSSARSTKSSSSDGFVAAKMIISIWTLDNHRYFTLTFTSSAGTFLNSPRTHSRTTSRIHNHTAISPSSRSDNSSPGSPSLCSHCGSISPGAAPSPASQGLSISPFPPLGAPAKSDITSSPTVLRKLSRMKDAIINAMEIPVIACWKDESLAIPNKAAMKMMHTRADPINNEAYDMLSRFRLYTADFQRELDPEEYPLIKLCRTQKPFTKVKIGVLDVDGNQRVCDLSGEGVYDEKTGEFLAGIVAVKDVTEYTDMIRSQIEESEQQLQLICETMPQMIWTTDAEGNHDWFSKRWYDYTGLSVEESIGLGWKNPFHPDDMAETSKRWTHSLATGDTYATEYRCKRYDGAWRWMLGRAMPLRDNKTGKILKWFGTCTDVQEVVEARDDAEASRERLMSVIKHAQTSVWAVDRHRNLVFLEGKMMWEDQENEGKHLCMGRNVYEVLKESKANIDIAKYQDRVEKILDGQGTEETIVHYISKTQKWYRTRFIPLIGQQPHVGRVTGGLVDGVVCISVDITQAKEQEQALKSQEEENIRLLTAETAAKEASRLKSQFLANMSHEIRTPIAGVIGMAELLIDTKLDVDQRDCAENIQRSANALLTVINDILDLSKVESGRLDIEEVQFSLSVVISDVSKMLAFAAERKNLDFKSDIQDGIEENLIVMGDPGRVRQILTNLLTNSFKFTSEGYVRLAVGTRRETNETISVIFTVEDTGIGIEEAVRKRLFQPFSQADSSTARRFGGTGLGLTICKNLVHLMHGEIRLESELGKGTKATFWIPFNKPQFTGAQSPLIDLEAIPERLKSEMSVSGCTSEGPNGSPTPPMSPAGETLNVMHGHRKQLSGSLQFPPISGDGVEVDKSHVEIDRKQTHVLVVEDNTINQQIAIKTIRKFGFSVNAVWNGKEALDYLMEPTSPSHPKPDIILMDVQMPILDGYRATHLIRHHSPYSEDSNIRTLPIVAMTASAIQGDKEKCRKAGMDDYLAKPVRGKTLENMLLKWALEGKRKARLSEHLNAVHDDSSCTDPESIIHNANDLDHDTSPQTSDAHVDTLASASALPGASNEGDRSMQRVEAEEKAIALRDDKLFAASELDPYHQHTPAKAPAVGPPSLPGSVPDALTEENVTRLDREQQASISDGPINVGHTLASPELTEVSPRSLTANPTPNTEHEDYSDTGSLAMQSTQSSSAEESTVGSLHGPSGASADPQAASTPASGVQRKRRGLLPRNESDRSQVTVTPGNFG